MARDSRLIRRGVAWNAVGTAVAKGTSVLAKLLLAQLLLPEHFGFVGMVVVLNSIAKVVADLGFRLTLIQRPCGPQTRLVYDSAFWLLLAAAVVTIGLMGMVGAPLLVWFYREPALAGVAVAMSTIIVFQNLQVIPEARLARLMRFRQIAIADIAGMLIGCGSAILLAWSGAGVWSLVAQALIAAAITCALNFLQAGWRPRPCFSMAVLRAPLRFGRYIVGSRLLLSVQQNLDYLLIGKLIGAHALGIYAIAFLLTETMRAQAYWLVSKAVFPFYSRAAGRDGDIRAVYLATVRFLSLAVFPVCMLLALFAPKIVRFAFSPEWQAAAAPLQILAVASMVVASAGTPGEVLRGIGHPDTDFRINLAVAALVGVPALWLGIRHFGLPGAALGVLCYASVSRIAFAVALRRLIGLSITSQLRVLRESLLGCALMVAAAWLLTPSHWVIGAASGLALYGAAVLPALVPQLRLIVRAGAAPSREAPLPS